MRIIDETGAEISSYDPSLGYLVEVRIFVAHHPAIAAIPEQFHYEIVREYPNGGKDLRKVIDVPTVPGRDAYDEYEDVLQYIPFPDNVPVVPDPHSTDLEARIAELEAALDMLLSGVTE